MPEARTSGGCGLRNARARPGAKTPAYGSAQRRPRAWLFLLEARRGGRPSMTIEPPKLFDAPSGLFEKSLGKNFPAFLKKGLGEKL